jgi:phage-related protein
MSSQLGEAFVPIRATLDKLDKDLEQARGKVRGAIGRIGKIAEGFGEGVQTAGKAALAGMVGLGGAALAAAGGMAALAANAEPLIGLQQGFAAVTDRIGTSSGTMLSALQDASGGLITNRDLMESFNKAAALVSDDFASTLPDAMSLVRKASQATGQDMGFLFDSLVTGVGRVSPMILDNLGIQISLAEVTEHAAEMFGKQASELSKTEQQAALTEIVMGKLNETYGDVPDTSNTFARARVMLANLKDEIGLKLLPVLTPLVEKLLEAGQMAVPILMGALDSILPVVTSIVTALSNFFAQLMNGIDPITAIVGLIGQLIFAFGGTSAQVQAVNNFVWALVENLRGLWDQITVLLEPIIAWAEQNIQLKDLLLAVGIAIASVVVPAIASIIAAVAPVVLAFAGLIAAVSLVRQAWETDWNGIRTTVLEFWENTAKPAFAEVVMWLQTNIPVALQTASNFWQNTLKPAIEAVWGFITGTLIPALGDVVSWLATNIPVAIETAKNFWEGTLRPALENVWSFIDGTLIPIFVDVVAWLDTNIPVAIDTAKDFWENTLQPALENVWSFIDGTLIPIFEDVATWLGTTIVEVVGDAKDAWENTLKPALETVWNFISNNVIPILEDLASFFTGTLIPGIADLASALEDTLKGAWERAMGVLQWGNDNVLAPLQGAFDGIRSAVQKVVDWVQKLADKIGGISLPDWLIPGSPTPFEIGLRGIADALREVDREWSGLKPPQFDLEQSVATMDLAARDMIPAGNSISYTSETTIHTDRDPMRVLRASRHLDKLGALT